MARFFTRLIDAQAIWSRPLGDFVHGIVHWLFHHMKPIHNFLNGTWLGHPLHSVLTDVPVGVFTIVVILDVLDYRAAADVTLVFGVLAMLGAAAAGYADYADTDGLARRRATVHSTVMLVALAVYIVSILIRWGNPADRTIALGTSIVGYLLVAVGAYIGGDVAYALGNMVNRHAFLSRGSKWVALQAPSEIPDGVPTRATADGEPLLLVRRGDTLLALHGTCAHAGGVLPEGTVVDGCIECPLHGSRFDLATGHLRRGPAVYDQPRYEVRRTDGAWEVRRAV